MKNYLLILFVPLLFLTSCKTMENVPTTVQSVDLKRYAGKWYEIAAYPQRFEKGCHCTTAEYVLTQKKYIRVINRCRKDSVTGDLKVAEGKAFVVPGSNNAKLKVQFFWPFKGNYWILILAPDYSYAVVGDPARKYLWILAREPKLDPALYTKLLEQIKEKGYDPSGLQRTVQECPQIR